MLVALQRVLANLGIHTEINTFLVLFCLIFARLATAFSLTPFLEGRSVAGRIKVGLALVISELLYTSVAPDSNLGDLNGLRVVGLLVKEVLIAATMGFLSPREF